MTRWQLAGAARNTWTPKRHRFESPRTPAVSPPTPCSVLHHRRVFCPPDGCHAPPLGCRLVSAGAAVGLPLPGDKAQGQPSEPATTRPFSPALPLSQRRHQLSRVRRVGAALSAGGGPGRCGAKRAEQRSKRGFLSVGGATRTFSRRNRPAPPRSRRRPGPSGCRRCRSRPRRVAGTSWGVWERVSWACLFVYVVATPSHRAARPARHSPVAQVLRPGDCARVQVAEHAALAGEGTAVGGAENQCVCAVRKAHPPGAVVCQLHGQEAVRCVGHARTATWRGSQAVPRWHLVDAPRHNAHHGGGS